VISKLACLCPLVEGNNQSNINQYQSFQSTKQIQDIFEFSTSCLSKDYEILFIVDSIVFVNQHFCEYPIRTTKLLVAKLIHISDWFSEKKSDNGNCNQNYEKSNHQSDRRLQCLVVSQHQQKIYAVTFDFL
jgi:hypothetical protein